LRKSTSRSRIGQDPRLQVGQETYFGSRCLGAKSLLGFNWTYVGVRQSRVNIKSAITMTAKTTSCSTAILAEKSILQILHLRV